MKMSLQEQIRKDMVNAMKTRENEKVSILRVVAGEFGRTMSGGKQLSDQEVFKILRRMAENAKELGNVSEFEILDSYLPKMLEPKEIKIIVKNVIETNGFTSIKEMGQVMGKIKQTKESQLIDMKVASTYIKELL